MKKNQLCPRVALFLKNQAISRVKSDRVGRPVGRPEVAQNPISAGIGISYPGLSLPPLSPELAAAPQSDAASLALAQAANALAALVQSMQARGATLPAAAPPALTAAAPAGISLITLINEYLRVKARAGKSDRFLRTSRNVFKILAQGRANRSILELTSSDIEQIIAGRCWNETTAADFKKRVSALYSYADLCPGYLPAGFRNPAKAVVIPAEAEESGEIGIHLPEEVARVLVTARRANLDVMRNLAIRYFAGIRTAELARLTEENIKLEQGVIEVSARKAKTRSRRLVDIHPTLAAWLALGGELKPLSPCNTIRPITQASGVAWPNNACRHSFGSYHVAAFENAGKTALQMGNSEKMVFRHYRAVVTRRQAEKFWSLTPDAAEKLCAES